MIKHRLLLFLLALCPAWMYAETITEEEARQNALAFLSERVSSGARKAPVRSASQKVSLSISDEAFYAYNVSGGGFVIVSASDRTQTVLGYSDTGTIDLEAAPEAFKAWLSRLSNVITAVDNDAITSAVDTTRTARRVKSVTKNVIPTLVSSRWNQGDPYNRQCPTYDNNGTATLPATGCVATAMSQVMYFWKWPSDSTTTIPGYTTNWNSTTTTYDDLPPTVFDWDAMSDTYDDSSSEASCDAVANLMHYVGRSIQMGYGASSGASSGNCVTALKNYYGYDKGCYLASADNYTYQEWEDLIYSELAAGRPLLMAGDTSDRTGGHEWVCDGYDGNGCYHMNWGWGGMCDGYFILTVMYPDQQGIGGSTSSDGYSMGQNIVVGLQPATSAQDDPDETVRISISNLSLDKTSYTRKRKQSNFSFSVTYGAGTSLSNTYNFDSAFTLYDEQGNIVKEKIGSESNFEIVPGTWWPSRSCKVTFGSGLDDGVYYIKGRSRKNGDTEWNEDVNFDKNYIKAVISDTLNLTLTVYPSVDLTVNALDLIGSGGVGTELKVRANITNNDVVEYYRDTYLLVDDQWVSGNCIVIPGGKTDDYYFKYTPSTSGEHTFALSTSKNASDAFYTTTKTIAEASSPNLTITMSALSEKSSSTVYGNTMRLKIKVANKGTEAYQSYIKASSWEKEGSVYWQRTVSQQDIDLAAGCDTTLYYEFTDLNYGSEYNFHTDSNGGASANLGDFTFAEGILYWTADGVQHGAANASGFTVTADMCAVSFPGSKPNSFSVDDDYNPNVILYFADGATVSSRVTTILRRKGVHNFVIGTEADTLILADGHDACVPRSFVAKYAKYVRVMDAADSDGEQWTTIALPFSPQTVTADGETIDWMRSADDTSKDFIVDEFSAIDGTTLYFTPAATFEANRPYIMAVKGSMGGTPFDLCGKTVTFSADNAEFETVERMSTYSTNYKFVGYMATTQLDSPYVLATDGTAFVQAAGGTSVQPFRAVMIANDDDAATVARLPISAGETTGIGVLRSDDVAEGADIYNLSGVKVGQYDPSVGLSSLPRGVYVIGGRKYVK